MIIRVAIQSIGEQSRIESRGGGKEASRCGMVDNPG